MKLQFDRFHQVSLAHLPTPLEFAKRLTDHLGGPRIWIKRDDCTGLAFGGNKARKLEFFMGDALRKRSDTIVTMGPLQSNHVRMTAAAACRLGLDCHAVLVGDDYGQLTGNFFLDHLFDLKYSIISKPLDELPPGLAEEEIDKTMVRLSREGRRPYLIPPGGAGPMGEISYCKALEEMVSQSRQLGIEIDYIITPVGSQGTFSGLILGKKLFGLNTKMIGISVNHAGTAELTGLSNIEQMVKDAGEFIDAKVTVLPEDYELLYDYVGKGYGIPTPGCMDAVKLMARQEGILLDTTYTGKSMAGLIDLVSKDRFNKGDNVVYLHTGGATGLFTNPDIFGFGN